MDFGPISESGRFWGMSRRRCDEMGLLKNGPGNVVLIKALCPFPR